MPPLVSLDELKTYLKITGTSDDALLASCASNASIQAERDTSRVFAVTSNVTHYYSTDGAASVTIHDRPFSDATRVVTWNGVALVENTGYWMLQDRRNPEVSTTIQIRQYDRTGAWYKADPQWWDKNLDMLDRRGGMPNDLQISGTVGHPATPLDVKQAVTELAAAMFWKAKSGASGVVSTANGSPVDIAELEDRYQRFVNNWRIRTAVTAV
ncbi:MAG: hypothetical protein RL139_1067 [Gemmatimonadota bacterium]